MTSNTKLSLEQKKETERLQARYLCRIIWVILAIVAVIDFVWVATHDYDASALYPGIPTLMIATYFVAVLPVCYRWYPNSRMILLSQAVLLSIAIEKTIKTLSLLIISLNRPFVDEYLISADSLLGFNWLNALKWLSNYPDISNLLSEAYLSINVQTLLLAALATAKKDFLMIYQFMLAFLLSVLICVILAGLFPALGGYIYFSPDGSVYQHLDLLTKDILTNIFPTVRDITLDIRAGVKQLPGSDPGMVYFPSFHACLAVLFMYVTWACVWARFLFIPLNITMLLATPVSGSHYLTDVITGVVVMLIVIWFMRKLSHQIHS